jgi:hypothetical protein
LAQNYTAPYSHSVTLKYWPIDGPEKPTTPQQIDFASRIDVDTPERANVEKCPLSQLITSLGKEEWGSTQVATPKKIKLCLS